MTNQIDVYDEHVKFFSKFVSRCLNKQHQPQIITVDQSRQVEKDDRYVKIFLERLLECDVITKVGWLGHIEAFALCEEAYKGDLTFEEIKQMLMQAIIKRSSEITGGEVASS